MFYKIERKYLIVRLFRLLVNEIPNLKAGEMRIGDLPFDGPVACDPDKIFGEINTFVRADFVMDIIKQERVAASDIKYAITFFDIQILYQSFDTLVVANMIFGDIIGTVDASTLFSRKSDLFWL